MSDWRARLNDPVMFIEGNDEEFRGQVCITSDTRPSPRHALERAIVHMWRMVDVPFEASRFLAIMECEGKLKEMPYFDRPKPPQFSWKGIEGKL